MSKVSPLFYFVLFRCFLVQTELVYWHVSFDSASANVSLTKIKTGESVSKLCEYCTLLHQNVLS